MSESGGTGAGSPPASGGGADSDRTQELTPPTGQPVRPTTWSTIPGASGVPARPSPLPPPRTLPGGPPRKPVAAGSRPVGTPRAPARPAPAGRGRRARLSLRRVDPLSVFLTSLALSFCLGIMTIVAAFVLYSVLDALGVPSSINRLVETLQGGQPVLTSSRFLGGAALLAAVNVVLLSVLATLGALLYNVVATFTGGIDVTLTERD